MPREIPENQIFIFLFSKIKILVLRQPLNGIIADLGLKLPIFVTCLFAGILITNLVPRSFPTITGTHWPARTPAMALIADIALGTFLAMSLMSMQLWTLIDLAAPILTILAAQFALAVIATVLILFPLMGRNYDAAVVAAGFGGVTLGSTPTAMANMAAVTQRFGPSHRAFIIVPLVSAFFIDLVNAMVIPFFLRTLLGARVISPALRRRRTLDVTASPFSSRLKRWLTGPAEVRT